MNLNSVHLSSYPARVVLFLFIALISIGAGCSLPLSARAQAAPLTSAQQSQFASLAAQLQSLRDFIARLYPSAKAQVLTTITFDNPIPPGSADALVNGIFQGIDWGTNQWRWSGPYASNTTNHIYFDSGSGISRTFSFSPAPQLLVNIRVYTSQNNGTLTLTDNNGQTKTQAITTGSMQTVTTNWTQPSTNITVNFTSGWDLGIDDIGYTAN